MKNLKAHVALCFVTLFYGFNYIVAKEVMTEAILPFTLTFLRISLVMVLFWIIHLFIKNKETIDRQDFFKLVICGITGVTTNQAFFLKGLSLTSPINAAIIVICTPVVVLIFSYFLLQEKITLKKALGIVLGLAGSLVLIVGSSNSDSLNVSFSGDLLVAINVISYSFYLVYVKSLMKKYRPLTVIKWVFLFGFFGIVPFAFQDVLQTNWQQLSVANWLAIAYVVLFATFGTYLLNIYALKKVNASLVGFYIYFQVIITTAIAIFLGKDSLDVAKVISTILIFTAVFLVSGYSFKKKEIPN